MTRWTNDQFAAFRDLADHLRRTLPLDRAVRVYRSARLNIQHMGDCSRQKIFVIRVADDLDFEAAAGTLIHEYAHALSWGLDEGEDHGECHEQAHRKVFDQYVIWRGREK